MHAPKEVSFRPKQGHYCAGQVANIVNKQAKHGNAPKLLMRATVAGGCENNTKVVKGRMLRYGSGSHSQAAEEHRVSERFAVATWPQNDLEEVFAVKEVLTLSHRTNFSGRTHVVHLKITHNP